MRSKEVLSIAAFVTAFVFSAALAMLFIPETRYEIVSVPVVYETQTEKRTSCFKYKNNAKTADKISALLRQDERNGLESSRHAFEMSEDGISPLENSTFSAYADSVEQYIDASGSIRADDLPNDFQTAWREHMKAWRDYSEFLNRVDKPSVRKNWSRAEYRDTDAFYNREISRTWYEVLRIGKIYGADITN